ncbi:peptidoglycan endopeptidase [Sphingomonas sanguinis]|uniref:Peptidoglycan endopeptidase n=1 Tax=Sphingomonas sanguinis TaxID=33051 RepID=A0ABU5LMC0_9SPHN|nr:peptidoglycan endopeptidase [Sphingomonas sanguinis]MDZ7281071.1 peptidoglycan endopeptidase [Sphingomonas sanguinis]QXT37469.1 peptidoglycan endopeptidase [Sphingomonas sanguinis]
MNGVEAAARALIGVRFRLHGRDAVHGLDCVGLVALATGRDAPTGYGWRSGDEGRVAALLDAAFERCEDEPGAVLLMQAGPGQLHLAIRVSDGIVHADAGLRRVAWRPGVPPWPVLGCWKGEG